MNTAVEASSFRAITEIAACPPAHPKHGAHTELDILTLYIARVPGSRDVFLTPLKPRDRVVTAEDVHSSLYYVHFNQADDVELLDVPDDQDCEDTPPASATYNNGSTFSRNAWISDLPGRPSDMPPPLPQRPAKSLPPLPARPSAIPRKPVMTDITNLANIGPPTLPVLPPRPLPTVPDEDERGQVNNNIIGHEQRSKLYDNVAIDHIQGYAWPSSNDSLEGALTLIRREPSNALQWNVATMYDTGVSEVISRPLSNSAFARRRTKKDGAPLCIDVTNSSYLKYNSGAVSRNSTSTNSSEEDAAPDGIFRCRLHLSATDTNHGQNNHHGDYTHSSESRLDVSTGITSSRSIDNHATQPRYMDMRKKGYSFRSPWDGQCEFTTSASGRALICKHALHQSVDTVSELRFNLPVTSKSTPSMEQRRQSYFSENKRHSRLDAFRGIGHMRSKSDDASVGASLEYEEASLSTLSLGQEMAGGGFGGRQPKLGKLIILPSGLAMLDLLVAANMALWWRAWEKVG